MKRVSKTEEVKELFNKLRTLFFQFAGIDQFDNDFSSLSNIKPISDAEKRAQQILKKYPHLKEAEIVKDVEQGWVRVTR